MVYGLKSLDYTTIISGMAQPQITRNSLEKVSIPVPPLPEQQAIASELDAIQSLITKYKEQLNDYDNLAKSIFNEMFGDVVSNDKGWERGKIGDVCEFSQGVQVEVSNQSIVESSNKIRFLRIVDFTQANEQPRYIDIPNEKYIISKEDISMVRYGASVGYVCCGLSGAIANNLFKITPQKNILGNTFCTYFLKSDYFQGKICNNKKGCAMPAINFKTIKPIPIPLPPLPLQQTFAARITAIESQKDKLKQQITDLQTLFDSRMQYYFD
jgi:type I restriction enzyme S subunit